MPPGTGDIAISVDTFRPEVAARSIEAGAANVHLRVLDEGFRFLMPAPERTFKALEAGLAAAGR